MVDFTPYKSPVYEGINDVPKIPTETEPGNGSDLIARFNALCEFLNLNLAEVATNGDYNYLGNLPDIPPFLKFEVNGQAYQGNSPIKKIIIEGANIEFYYDPGLGIVRVVFASTSGSSSGGGGAA